MPKTAPKILIAEDDPFFIKLLVGHFKEDGFEVDFAENGQEALDLAAKNHYSILMTDLLMPVKTGFDVLKELKIKGNKTPIIVFSSLSQGEDVKEALALGAKAIFDKSNVSLFDLTGLVRNFLPK